jgi:hypothetical protein
MPKKLFQQGKHIRHGSIGPREGVGRESPSWRFCCGRALLHKLKQAQPRQTHACWPPGWWGWSKRTLVSGRCIQRRVNGDGNPGGSQGRFGNPAGHIPPIPNSRFRRLVENQVPLPALRNITYPRHPKIGARGRLYDSISAQAVLDARCYMPGWIGKR